MRTHAARGTLGARKSAVERMSVAAPSGGASSKPCHPKHSVTLKRSSKARIYRIKGQPRTQVYGCLFSTNESHRLPIGRHAKAIRLIHLRGRYVGYVTAQRDPKTDDSNIVGARSFNLK